MLGVDVSHVGFLTEVRIDELDASLDAVHEGRMRIDARLMLTMRASPFPLEIPPGTEALIRYGQRSDPAAPVHPPWRR